MSVYFLNVTFVFLTLTNIAHKCSKLVIKSTSQQTTHQHAFEALEMAAPLVIHAENPTWNQS